MAFFDRVFTQSRSFADPHDTPKAAVRAAGVGGIADLAIRRNRPFASDKIWEDPRELKRQVLAYSVEKLRFQNCLFFICDLPPISYCIYTEVV